MPAVNATTHTFARARIFAGLLSIALAGCGGAAVHSGYAAGDAEPWAKPIKLRMKNTGDASMEGVVNFAKRERAKWYSIDLPAPGNLQAKLKMDPKSIGADVGFEVLDAGFNVVAKALDDNDIGQDDKLRNVREARSGTYYFHVFALQRTDVAEYKLRVRYDPLVPVANVEMPAPEPVDPKSTFPWTVANLPPLAQIPASDDTPRGGKAPKTEPEEEKPQVETDPWVSVTLIGRVVEFKQVPGGVLLTINRGSTGGVEEGMIGAVVDSSGRSLQKGTFKVKKVTTDECEGVVGLTMDQVQANRRVKLKAAE
jgi:hypothetical protein